MKPFKSFLFIVFALSIFSVLPMVCPSGKLLISGIEIRIFNFDFLKNPARKTTNTPETNLPVNQNNGLKESGNPVNQIPKPPEPVNFQTSVVAKTSDSGINLSDSEIELPPQITYKWSESGEKLLNAKLQEKPLRILYYGDSQIENDRITSAFRKVLQERFGGAGRGLVPVENIYNSANNFEMTASENWESESVIKTEQNHLDLGLLCEAFKVRHPEYGKNPKTSAWVKIKSLKENLVTGYTVLSIFYKTSGKSELSVTLNTGSPIHQELSACEKICEARFELNTTPQEIELYFSTSSEITVYGLNFESPTGIMVDNIALRGLSSPEFTKIDTTRLSQMVQLLNPAFVILQYGVNIVPNKATDYSFYMKKLNRELGCLRKIIPDVPILMISVSDMACKVGGNLESYPNIENVLTAQKEAALENGCAFWNLFESMGGKGSMITWVENKPPLGNRDYVHYTQLGAEKVGNLLARQFIKALEPGFATAMLVHEP